MRDLADLSARGGCRRIATSEVRMIGGRSRNRPRAAIDMLPQVVRAAGSTPVLFDSGMRSGSDVIKAIALGAAAVGVGRPYVYGLALGGAEGVAHVLRCILAEADLLMVAMSRFKLQSSCLSVTAPARPRPRP